MTAGHARILLAEQRSTTTGMTLHSLCADDSRNLELKVVSNHARLFEVLRGFRPDVAIVDLALLQPNPIGAISILRAVLPEIPLILLADPADRDSVAACLEAGATDYMLEGFMDHRTLDRSLHAALFGSRGLLPERVSGNRNESKKAIGNQFPEEVDRRQHLEGKMTSKIGMRVTLRNLQDVKDRLGAAAADRLLEGVGTFLQKRLRGTDRLEQGSWGEFHLSIMNADSGCLPALQRRISAAVLQSQFSKSADCVPEFCVETEAPCNSPALAGGEEMDKAMYSASGAFQTRQ